MGFFLSNSLCRTGGVTAVSETQPVIDHQSNKLKQNKNTKTIVNLICCGCVLLISREENGKYATARRPLPIYLYKIILKRD